MSTLTRRQPATEDLQPRSIPELENGDRLTRAEFERRYDAMPQLKKAELIEGEIYIPSPVRHQRHGRPHSQVIGWLIHYEAATPGVQVGDNGSLRLDLDNELQPDAYLMIAPDCGGQARIDQEDYVAGAPELIVEVASSSVSYDLHAKMQVYRRSGVCEYVVWRVLDQQVDWFVLHEGRFDPMDRPADGLYRSTAFPGLWLDPTALLSGDLARVLAVVQDGLKSAEHQEFVTRLGAAK
jgi:Uma2 family endonuclease